MLSLLVLSLPLLSLAWPDGAPCIHSAYESMNPLEAVEHQGGLQLSPPPYEIKVEQKCYWRNQPIALTLQGLNDTVNFKGFVIQPYQWTNDRLGERVGQMVRLDDNGSWQQQCFRFKDSATHSHDEKKKHIRMWWKVDNEVDTVQFVATVVKHQTMFWVRSVYSTPIPPCRLNRFGITNYVPPVPSVPPMTKQFKMQTSNLFGNQGLSVQNQQQQPSAAAPQPLRSQTMNTPMTAAPTTSQEPTTLQTTTPSTVHDQNVFVSRRPGSSAARMHQIIPIPQMEVVHRHGFSPVPVPTPSIVSNTPFQGQFKPQAVAPMQQQQQLRTPQQMTQTCFDRDVPSKCRSWARFCRSPQFFRYMSMNCRATCSLC